MASGKQQRVVAATCHFASFDARSQLDDEVAATPSLAARACVVAETELSNQLGQRTAMHCAVNPELAFIIPPKRVDIPITR